MKILGLLLRHENISDEQYVERIRKSLKSRRRWRSFIVAMGLLILCFLLWFIPQIINILSNLNGLGHAGHGTQNSRFSVVYAVYFIAIIMGYFTGFMFFHAVFQIMEALFGYRKDKLLVEFWDSLSDAEKSRLRQQTS